jgi:hypothetical protein
MASFSLRGSLRIWQRRKKRAARLVHKWDRIAKDHAANKQWRKREYALERRRHWSRKITEADRWIKKRKDQIARRENSKWGGARAVTNEVIRIVNGRVPVTSRKRWELFGNPGSDHHRSQKTADAVDFGTAENYALAREIASRLGAPGQWSGDYDDFIIQRNGRAYRVQMIAGTHGTGPHLHVGVRRLG